MVASRKRPKGVRYYGPFGLSVLTMSLMPRQIGYQDMVALMARQPEVSQRARAHMLASPFGTIHTATFSFPRPVGTLIPDTPLRLASAGDGDVTGSIARDPSGGLMSLHRPRFDFPSVNRRLKGDLLVSRPHPAPPPPPGGTRDLTPGRVKTVSFPKPAEVPADEPAAREPDLALAPEPAPVLPNYAGDAATAPKPLPAPTVAAPAGKAEAAVTTAALGSAVAEEAYVVTAALSPRPAAAAKTAKPADEPGDKAAGYKLASLSPADRVLHEAPSPLLDTIDEPSPEERLGRLYFGGNRNGQAVGAIQPWPMDEEMLIRTPPANDPDIKLSALRQPSANEPDRDAAGSPAGKFDAKPDDKPDAKAGGQTLAAKGEVTGPGKRPKTPSERLGLNAKLRAKAEKCLAEAVYFESRGEPKRGQIAVAQVVMNRVFSGFYPTNVCGVVYQNAHRKLACQFTFACDNVPDVVNEPDMWSQAKGIARDMLDGKLWLPEIAHSTHYHAYWVHPSWVNEMRRMHKIGVHSFYRPRAWGDGSDAPPLRVEPQKQTKTGDAEKKAKS